MAAAIFSCNPGASDIVKRRVLEKIPRQLEASFLFLKATHLVIDVTISICCDHIGNNTVLCSPPFTEDCQCMHTSTVAPISYVQSCLLRLAACSQHDGWMSVAGRLGNHEVTLIMLAQAGGMLPA